MGYRRPNIRVELSGEFWAEILPKLSLGAQEMVVKLSRDGHDERIARSLIISALAAWNLTDDAGAPLPITDETVAELYEDDAMALIAAINAARAPRTIEEQQVFTQPSTPGPEDEEERPLALSGWRSTSSSPGI